MAGFFFGALVGLAGGGRLSLSLIGFMPGPLPGLRLGLFYFPWHALKAFREPQGQGSYGSGYQSSL